MRVQENVPTANICAYMREYRIYAPICGYVHQCAFSNIFIEYVALWFVGCGCHKLSKDIWFDGSAVVVLPILIFL